MVRTLCVGVGVFVICLSAVRADDKKEDPEITLLKARLEAQTQELQALRKWVDEAEHERIKLILDKEAALRAAIQAQNEAKLARAIADEHAKKIEALTAKLRELKAPNAGGPDAPVPAADLRGAVTKVVGEFVAINIGVDAGVEPGAVLEVIRIDGKNETSLGKVTITKTVYPKEAVGAFTPARKVPLSELKPEELPRKGDTVRTPTPAPRK